MLSRKISNFSPKSAGEALGFSLREGVDTTEGAAHASFIVDSVIEEEDGWRVVVVVVWEPVEEQALFSDENVNLLHDSIPQDHKKEVIHEQEVKEAESLEHEKAAARKASRKEIEEEQKAALEEHEKEIADFKEHQRENINDIAHEIMDENRLTFFEGSVILAHEESPISDQPDDIADARQMEQSRDTETPVIEPPSAESENEEKTELETKATEELSEQNEPAVPAQTQEDLPQDFGKELEKEKTKPPVKEEIDKKIQEIIDEEAMLFLINTVGTALEYNNLHTPESCDYTNPSQYEETRPYNLVIESKYEELLDDALPSDQEEFIIHVVPSGSIKNEAEKHPIDLELHEASTAAEAEKREPSEKPEIKPQPSTKPKPPKYEDMEFDKTA